MTGRVVVTLLVLSLAMPAVASAQDARAEAVAEPIAVAVGDTVQYTLRVSAKGNTAIQLIKRPDFGSLKSVGSNRGTEFRSVNGTAELSFNYNFSLKATRPGKILIRGAVAEVGGKRISPKPVVVTVVPAGKTPPAPDGKTKGSVWIYGSVTNRKPYLGEQVLLEFSLMMDDARVGAFGVEINDLKDPSFDGFWVEPLSEKVDARANRREMHGKSWTTRLIQVAALFPLRVGRRTIEPLELDVSVANRMGLGRRRQRIKSDAIVLDVLPLPPGAPAGFDESNVGQYQLAVAADKKRVRVGEALTVRVTVSGRGQVGRVEVPTMPESKGYRLLPPVYDKEVGVLRDRRIGGRKTAEIVVTPLAQGHVRIPALKFVYFDPARAEYVTLVSKEQRVPVKGEVKGGAKDEVELVEREGRQRPKAVQKAEEPLRAVREVTDRGERTSQRPGAVFWAGVVAPPLLWLGLLVFGAVRRRAAQAAPEKERKSAAEEARATLQGAGDAEVGALLTRYLAARLDIPPGSVAASRLRRIFEERGADADAVGRLLAVRTKCDEARFSGETDDAGALRDEVLAILTGLEAWL
jgi:hypothetical protein